MSRAVQFPSIGRHHVTFLAPSDVDCILHAKLGWSTQAICELTGLSRGQVLYRVSKAQTLELGKPKNNEKRPTYRMGWRSGVSPEAQMVSSAIRLRIKRQIQRTLPPLIEAIPYAQTPRTINV